MPITLNGLTSKPTKMANCNSNRFFITIGIITLFAIATACSNNTNEKYEDWPQITSQQKPWTRWWWMGNTYDKPSITAQLEAFAQAGIGGVEITPIYGTNGYEEQSVDFLSPKWIDMLEHTINEAERLGMQVDMVMGTGWPFGGPQVEPEFAASKLSIQKYELEAGQVFENEISIRDPKQKGLAKLQKLIAIDQNGELTDIMPLLKDEKIKYASSTKSTIYAIFCAKTRQQVKRSAPGGAGYTLDHYSAEAFTDYALPFTEALAPVKNKIRGMFNDSYEVYGADFSPVFLEEFQKRRHYDLLNHIQTLAKPDNSANYKRLLCDYRETLADMLLENFANNWTQWSHNNSFITKYQAHGSPGNLIDLYAAADIPECEVFGSPKYDIPGYRRDTNNVRHGDSNKMMLKFASSAAHLQGNELVSSETFTWLREHFKTALSHCKPLADDLFLSGVNHIFLHGSTFSPVNEEWPGWKFYASVNFTPANTIWKDAKNLFEYIARCQSILQLAKTDNEVLLYFPVHDVYTNSNPQSLMHMLSIHTIDDWLLPTSFYQIATQLDSAGIGFDFISDSFVVKAKTENGTIKTSENTSYKTIIVPDTDALPLETLSHLLKLKSEGAAIIFAGLPETVPGLFNLEQRENTLKKILKSTPISITRMPIEKLNELSIYGEQSANHGLKIIRKKLNGSNIYFVANHSNKRIDQFVHFNAQGQNVLLMDALTQKTGLAKTKQIENGTDVLLQLDPGQSIFVQALNHSTKHKNWEYFEQGKPIEINGPWQIEFIEGGPLLPPMLNIDKLASWTTFGTDYENFSGTARYTTHFELPDSGNKNWQLQLGDIRESARVFVNGKYAGTCFAHPFNIDITNYLTPGKNQLDIEVTNLAANRLRALEISGKEWKKFHEINMVNIHYEKFDATKWDILPSGLCSPVTLIPLN